MNILIMHFIEKNATNGEKFILQKFLKKDMTLFQKMKLHFGLDRLKTKVHWICHLPISRQFQKELLKFLKKLTKDYTELFVL